MPTLDLAAARAIALAALNESDDEAERALLDDATETYDFGWMFYYQLAEYVRTGDPDLLLAGNGPLLVNRSTGEVRWGGTACPPEWYADNYRHTGDPLLEPEWSVRIVGIAELSRVAAARVLRQHTPVTLTEALRAIDGLTRGGAVEVAVDCRSDGEALCEALTAAGLDASCVVTSG